MRWMVLALAGLVWIGAGTPATADELGARVYERICAACHGADGTGDTAAGQRLGVPDLTIAGNWRRGRTAAAVEATVRYGHGHMPRWDTRMSWRNLSAVARYMRTLTGADQD